MLLDSLSVARHWEGIKYRSVWCWLTSRSYGQCYFQTDPARCQFGCDGCHAARSSLSLFKATAVLQDSTGSFSVYPVCPCQAWWWPENPACGTFLLRPCECATVWQAGIIMPCIKRKELRAAGQQFAASAVCHMCSCVQCVCCVYGACGTVSSGTSSKYERGLGCVSSTL